ncbi:RNA polymerase subunit sigma-24 [Streptomyces agglomeratus]|uniref:RNA polymerase subunit sigma-24 n=2 Tax=Streptomyces agglomeratus TaxID=285458 RepID=A0A1E5NYX4_9ACTN|nr:sigma-70 family RNA polymerase sigma factor [Streptomyces agglomeratus]OEJ21512.1 RNA polymerase subunit sigma-24 [Streptomyces agglomeratus]
MTTKLPVDFSAFHQMHRPAYIRWAETILNNRSDAEEAVDAAFEQLLKVWPDVLTKENPAGYAWRVLRNITIDTGKARGRRPVLLDMAAFETAALLQAVDPIGQLEESMNLFRIIGELPPRQMDVMLLLHANDLSVDQVAAELGITPAGVRSNARHAKRRLRQTLGLDAANLEEGHADDIAR